MNFCKNCNVVCVPRRRSEIEPRSIEELFDSGVQDDQNRGEARSFSVFKNDTSIYSAPRKRIKRWYDTPIDLNFNMPVRRASSRYRMPRLIITRNGDDVSSVSNTIYTEDEDY
jgi:hypothetical protein